MKGIDFGGKLRGILNMFESYLGVGVDQEVVGCSLVLRVGLYFGCL